MSGGSLDYFYLRLEEEVGDFEDWELDELVKDLADLFHDREWYTSGDYCEGDWVEARDAFKAKWFAKAGRDYRLEKRLADLQELFVTEIAELRVELGLTEPHRCFNCKNWTAEDESQYGSCKHHKMCLMHRSETCERWEARQ